MKTLSRLETSTTETEAIWPEDRRCMEPRSTQTIILEIIQKNMMTGGCLTFATELNNLSKLN